MKIIDLTEHYAQYYDPSDPGDNPNDDIGWKTLMYDDGYTHVIIGDKLHLISKWGPTDIIGTIHHD